MSATPETTGGKTAPKKGGAMRWLIGVPVGAVVYIVIASILRHGYDVPAWAAFTWPIIGVGVLWGALEWSTRSDAKKG